jgi:hypothetical protein
MSIETPLEKTRRCWGKDLPDWVEGLAKACMQSSQNKVAKAMGYSGSLISAVLANKYPGDLERVEQMYRGVFEKATVTCPAQGEMPISDCRTWRTKSRRYNPVNSRNVMMFRACKSCPLNAEEKP